MSPLIEIAANNISKYQNKELQYFIVILTTFSAVFCSYAFLSFKSDASDKRCGCPLHMSEFECRNLIQTKVASKETDTP